MTGTICSWPFLHARQLAQSNPSSYSKTHIVATPPAFGNRHAVGPQSPHAAICRRVPNAPTDIRTHPQATASETDQRALAAARPPARQRRVERVHRDPEDVVRRLEVHQRLRLRGARVEHGAGGPQDVQDQRLRRAVVAPRAEAGVGRAAAHRHVLLDADGQAVQRPDGLAVRGEVRVELGGAGERAGREQLGNAVRGVLREGGAAQEGGGGGGGGEGPGGEGGEEGFRGAFGDADFVRGEELGGEGCRVEGEGGGQGGERRLDCGEGGVAVGLQRGGDVLPWLVVGDWRRGGHGGRLWSFQLKKCSIH